MNIFLILVSFSIKYAYCRDFYMGMFKRNDYLVAQDSIYKGAATYSHQYTKYGRFFKCPITYFRVVDRLGLGRGPTVQIVRGGLLKKYIVARIKSPYNLPLSVNIYVGCENKDKGPVWKRPTRATTTVQYKGTDVTDAGSGSGDGEGSGKEGDTTPEASGGTAAATEGGAPAEETTGPGETR